jgi:predicted AAA+ superfamily ATPase
MFTLNNELGEPLVGKKYTLFKYPLSQIEFSNYENYKNTAEKLEERLLFGGYPELIHINKLV